jgi:hypothetical protein
VPCGSPTKVRQTCTVFYAANILNGCCQDLRHKSSLIIFGSIGNIQKVGDGGSEWSTAAFSGCLPPAKGMKVALLIVVCCLR